MFQISKKNQLKSLSCLFTGNNIEKLVPNKVESAVNNKETANETAVKVGDEKDQDIVAQDSDCSEQYLDEQESTIDGNDEQNSVKLNGASRRERAEEQKRINARTIFVGNVPMTALDHQKQFKKLFVGVESLRFRSIAFTSHRPRKIQFVRKEFHEQRDSMNAYVVFKTRELAEKALELNGVVFMDKHLRINSLEKQFSSAKSLFIGNLPFDLSEESLYELFGVAGDITSVRVIRDRKTNVGKGFAYVEFKDKESVSLGLKLNGSELKGRKIRVSKSKDNLAQGKKVEGHRATKRDGPDLKNKIKKKQNFKKVGKK